MSSSLSKEGLKQDDKRPEEQPPHAKEVIEFTKEKEQAIEAIREKRKELRTLEDKESEYYSVLMAQVNLLVKRRNCLRAKIHYRTHPKDTRTRRKKKKSSEEKRMESLAAIEKSEGDRIRIVREINKIKIRIMDFEEDLSEAHEDEVKMLKREICGLSARKDCFVRRLAYHKEKLKQE